MTAEEREIFVNTLKEACAEAIAKRYGQSNWTDDDWLAASVSVDTTLADDPRSKAAVIDALRRIVEHYDAEAATDPPEN